MIVPDLEAARAYLNSANTQRLADQILRGEPWFCDQVGVDFRSWSRDILAACDFPRAAVLHLVGSAANGISLAPEKAGAPFRMFPTEGRPSDLDFCLVDHRFFTQAWNSMVHEDQLFGSHNRLNRVRLRVYWGRIEEGEVLSLEKAQLRRLVDAIRRTPEYRGYPASVRIYRRHADLRGYTVWCLEQLKKVLRQ